MLMLSLCPVLEAESRFGFTALSGSLRIVCVLHHHHAEVATGQSILTHRIPLCVQNRDDASKAAATRDFPVVDISRRPPLHAAAITPLQT